MLVSDFGLDKYLQIHSPLPGLSQDQLTRFHADEYIDFLKGVNTQNQDELFQQVRRFNLGPVGETDCPVFPSLFRYCQLYSAGSVGGAAKLASGENDIVLNWSGGMHHAKRAEASGFCYVNDIVLAILELLRTYPRILYVDIDIHHGDGVEEAFYTSDRVFTLSFHKYGDFFPGTGALGDVGYGQGKGYSLNVPLKEGMDDESYKILFKPIVDRIMSRFDPKAVVVCAGADSLAQDKLGCFNLSVQGHGECLEVLSSYQIPMLVVGGGGYTLRNVARCWTYETSKMLQIDLPNKLPEKTLRGDYNWFMDSDNLHIEVSNMQNANTTEDLQGLLRACYIAIDQIPAVPSVQMQHAPQSLVMQKELELEEEVDVRGGGIEMEAKRVIKPGNESDEEEDLNPLPDEKILRAELQDNFKRKRELISAQVEDVSNVKDNESHKRSRDESNGSLNNNQTKNNQ
eukprot:TRINITY_DN6106_c1_g1_i5.p1 TRINITY_DN6106_c1_g1~~TRINITY_DN6106_c1_g1_i5.p1  ORF type:complete len:513 (+),score=52.79 TRINITY_DN6106_c1_g1_i5:170-1540(+)